MTTYIERVVTEVAVTPEASEGGEQADNRWHELEKVDAALKARIRQELRLAAEGFDD